MHVIARRIEKIILWFFALLLLSVALASGGLYFWLSSGKKDLSRYNQYIEESFESQFPAYDFKIMKTELGWVDFEERLIFEVSGLEVSNLNGSKLSYFPNISLDFSLPNLLVGDFIPTKIELSNSVIEAEKLAALVASGQGVESSAQNINLKSLNNIKVNKTKVFHKGLGLEFLIDEANFEFDDDAAFFVAKLLNHKYEELRVSGNLNYSPDGLQLDSQISNLSLKDYWGLVPQVGGVDINFDSVIKLTASNDVLKDIEVELLNINGEVANEILPENLKVLDSGIKVLYDFATEESEVKDLSLKFEDGMSLSGSGKLRSEQDMDLDLSFENLKAANLKNYWPNGVGVNAISWISEHIPSGYLPSGSAKISLKDKYFAEGAKIPDEAVDFRFNYQNLLVDYLDKLLPAKAVSGSAKMDVSSLTMDIDSAKVGESKLSDTRIVITGIGDDAFEIMTIYGLVNGQAKDLADFYQNLAKGKKFFTKDDVQKGTALAEVSLKFPLDSNLRLDDVDYEIKAEVNDANINNIREMFDARNSSFQLMLDSEGLEVKGNTLANIGLNEDNVKLASAPAVFVLRQGQGREIVAIDIDAKNAEIQIPELSIEKNIGQPAALKFKYIGKPASKEIRDIALTSDSLKFTGSALLNTAGDDLAQLNIDRFDFGESNLKGVVLKANGYSAKLESDYFDISPILAKLEEEEDSEGEIDFDLEMSAKKIGMLQQQDYENVTIKLSCEEGECDRLLLQNPEIKISYLDDKMNIGSSDAGKLLRALDIYDYMQGGKLKIAAADEVDDGSQNGELLIEDFRIIKSNFLTKILTLGSLTGMADLLNGKGIAFDKLKTNFAKKDDRFEVEDFRMKGSAIGANAEGWFDTKQNQIAIAGKVIPAYTANTLLGEVPVVGKIFIGDEGVFAISYKIEDKFDEPKISVNPLSVLAPGFLKNIFFNDSVSKPKPAEPAASD